MSLSPSQHLLSALHMEAQIALASVAELFLEVNATVLAVGVRPEMKDSRSGDDSQAGDHFVERFAAVRFSGEHMNAARRTDDVFVAELTALRADALNLLFDDWIDPVVITGEDGVSDGVQFLWELLHSLFSLLVRLGEVKEPEKQNVDLR